MERINETTTSSLRIELGRRVSFTPMGDWKESFQLYSFPFVVFIVWFVLRRTWFGFSLKLVLLSISLWLVSAFYFWGDFPAWAYSGTVVLTELTPDQKNLNIRESFRIYEQHARNRQLPQMVFIRKLFASDNDARNWLSSSGRARAVLKGRASWPRVVLSADARNFFVGEEEVISPGLLAEAEKLDIDVERQAISLKIDDLGLTFLVQASPEAFDIPGRPQFLQDEFLGQFASGLGTPAVVKSKQSKVEIATNAGRRDRFLAATSIEGQWRSGVAQGVAAFFLGTHDILTAIQGRSLELPTLECAIRSLLRAAGKVPLENEPETYSAIYNNLGIARVMEADGGRDFSQARKWFRLAAAVKSCDGAAPLGARLAMFNLITLKRSGL